MRWDPQNDLAARSADGVWGRGRLQATLAAGIVAGLVFTAGLGLALFYGLTPRPGPGPGQGQEAPVRAAQAAAPEVGGGGAAVTGPTQRDRVAAASMLTVAPEDARAGVPAASAGPVIHVPGVPAATGPGAGPVSAGVPTGFPHTPEGAVGQLAAIETTVLQGMSIPQAHQVYEQWALPGGVGAARWTLTRNVQSFLASSSAGDSRGQSKDPTVTVSATPAAGQVKGTDGADWVLACVLLDVRATITTAARIGYGYCERLQWHPDDGAVSTGPGNNTRSATGRGTGASTTPGGRWMIAPGAPAATAPSTWPGTDLSFRAGWRTWVTTAPVTPEPVTARPAAAAAVPAGSTSVGVR